MKAASRVVTIALFTCALYGTACNGVDQAPGPDAPPDCVENLNLNCAPIDDPPIYSTIYQVRIQPQCTLGSGCHSADAAMGGLVLTNADDTYGTLLGLKGGTKHVVPGDAACSPLMVRLESHDPNFQMPRGSRLTEPELCDFVKWIQAGAQKN
jgi:hypothetical protein